MARPRKPTAIHALTGAIETHPERFRERANEPRDDRPLGDPPIHLKPAEIVAWQEIQRISPPGVLCHGDRLAVELTASLLAAFRALGSALPEAKLRRLESMLGQLGLTPAARSKVTVHRGDRSGGTNRFGNNGRR